LYALSDGIGKSLEVSPKFFFPCCPNQNCVLHTSSTSYFDAIEENFSDGGRDFVPIAQGRPQMRLRPALPGLSGGDY